MTLCVVARAGSRTLEQVEWSQATVALELDGPVTFVGRVFGAVDLPDIVLVARRSDKMYECLPLNACFETNTRWCEEILFDATRVPRGDVVFAAFDCEGGEVNLDLEALVSHLNRR